MLDPFLLELDDGVFGEQRDDTINTKFRRLLDDPVHFFTLQQRLGKNERGTGSGGRLYRLKNTGDQLLGGDVRYLSAISDGAIVGERQTLSRLDAQTIFHMNEKGTGNSYGRGRDSIGCHKKRRHRTSEPSVVVRGGERYSKNVFILSKKPSPSASIVMPLSLANSMSNSFCLAVSLVGICTLIVNS